MASSLCAEQDGLVQMSVEERISPSAAVGYREVRHALTVDVEDYFQVSAFRNVVSRDCWPQMPSRVERNTENLLELFSNYDLHATFFVLGWIAERFPRLVRRIHECGHELGCHSFAHRLVYELNPSEFREDTRRAVNAIADAAGALVYAYRAPSFSITLRSLWALEVLVELGFRYDSSIFPIRHDLYGLPSAPRQPFRVVVNGGQLVEFPPPTQQFGPWTIPVTGGGYLRFLPFSLQRRALQIKHARSEPFLLYLHPWELDTDQPRIPGPLTSRLRHYTGLARTSDRLRHLIEEFPFGTLSEAVETTESLPEWRLP